jgi:polysaccharide pyruvyl transferase WcaK-like protein
MMWYAKTRLGIPCFFLNGSVTLTDVDPILPAMIRKEFAVFDGVMVREPWSLRNCARYLPGIPVHLAPDSVFHFQRSDATAAAPGDLVPALRSGEPYFCFSLSMLPMDFVRTRGRSSVVGALRLLKTKVPQAVLMAKDGEDQFLKSVAAETRSLFFGPSRTFRDVMALLGGARFLFTGRYHHAILAAIMGCPAVPMITTSHKMNGLCELLGLPDYEPLDPTDLWTEMPRLEARVTALLAGGDPWRARVQAAADRLRPDVDRMGEMVAAGLARAGKGAVR